MSNYQMKQKVEIIEELKKEAPVLMQLKNQEIAPKIPENYFDALAKILFQEISAEKNITQILPKNNPIVPSGYFESFEHQLLKKIHEEEAEINAGTIQKVEVSKKKKLLDLFQNIAIAAALIGFVFLVKDIQTPTSQFTDNNKGTASLSKNEIYNYMNEHSYEFDLQDIQQATASVINLQDAETIEMNDEEIGQYIKVHNNIIETDDFSTSIF